MKYILIILLFIHLLVFTQNKQTPEDIVGQIKKNVTCRWADKTVDTFKAGNPGTTLKGIAVCMFADMETLQKAVQMNCNFIITHEPVFYNHTDETDSFQNDEVFKEKMNFIEQNDLVIFRFHDHIHRTAPDGIYAGMIDQLGWKGNQSKTFPNLFQFKPLTLKDFAQELKQKTGRNTVRIIGDPEMVFSKAALAVGAPGGPAHIRLLRNPDVEVLVAGEAPEWETYLYANDAVSQGKNKAVVFLGHIKSEEAGMKYCTDWLKQFVKNTPVHFIQNKSNFTDL